MKSVKKQRNYARNNEIGLMWSGQSFWESTISNLESPLNFQVKEKKLLKSVEKQRNYALIKKCQNRHDSNGRTDVPVSIIELLRFSQVT